MKNFLTSRAPHAPRPAPSPKSGRMLMGTLLLALAGGTAQTVLAQPMGPEGMHGMGAGMAGPGMIGGRMLDLVNATADQRAQIKTIMDAARTDLKASRDSGRTLHQQMQAAFSQTTIDARTVEALRVQMQALHDTESKRMTQAMLDASNVLTADQRKTLADAMAKRQALMQRQAAERAAIDKSTTK